MIDTILVNSSDLATAIARNGSRAAQVGTLAEVRDALFTWEALEGPLSAITAAGFHEVPTHKAIVRSDTGAVLGVVGKNYQVHGYQEWLTDNLANIVDDTDVVVQSAGLLNGGARAWVQITRPEVQSVNGFEYQPFILAGTSLDGSTATIYKRNAIAIVCQNTYAASMAGTPDMRIKHTRNSAFQLSTARDALGIMFAIEDEFSQHIDELMHVSVNDRRFEDMVTEFLGGTPDPNATSTRGASIFDRKFESIVSMWETDARVAPWRGTGLGAMQAFSTWQQHESDVRGASRAERNADRLLSGAGDAFDGRVRSLILA